MLINFMQRLIKDAQRKVKLILDNPRAHPAKVVNHWLAEYGAEIDVFYEPAYSPEMRSDEYLNCDLNAGVHSGTLAQDKEQLVTKVRSHMRMLQKKLARVRKYFRNGKIAHVAWRVYLLLG